MLSLNRIKRIHQRIVPYLENTSNERLLELKSEFHTILIKNVALIYTTIFCYLLLYVSIVTTILGDFVLLTFFQKAASVIGSTILVILIAILHWYMSLLVSDAHTISSEIIALGEKYKK